VRGKRSRPEPSTTPSRKSDVVEEMGSIVGVYRGIEEAFKEGRTRTRAREKSSECGASGLKHYVNAIGKAETKLALTLHYSQHETRDGAV
jgi:hypothetical protein